MRITRVDQNNTPIEVMEVPENFRLDLCPDMRAFDESTDAQLIAWDLLREERDALLVKTDKTQLMDAPYSEQERLVWATYRQSLRDLPSNTVDPLVPIWPTPPE